MHFTQINARWRRLTDPDVAAHLPIPMYATSPTFDEFEHAKNPHHAQHANGTQRVDLVVQVTMAGMNGLPMERQRSSLVWILFTEGAQIANLANSECAVEHVVLRAVPGSHLCGEEWCQLVSRLTLNMNGPRGRTTKLERAVKSHVR